MVAVENPDLLLCFWSKRRHVCCLVWIIFSGLGRLARQCKYYCFCQYVFVFCLSFMQIKIIFFFGSFLDFNKIWLSFLISPPTFHFFFFSLFHYYYLKKKNYFTINYGAFTCGPLSQQSRLWIQQAEAQLKE